VHRIGGVDYAFVFGDVYKIDREAGGRLVYVNSISTGHDIYVRDTPWNTTWALSADGSGGLRVVDVTDPAHPFDVGTWDAENHAQIAYYLHTADVAFVGDQTLVVISSEDFVPGATVMPGPGGEKAPGLASPFWVLDGNPMRAVRPGENATALNVLGTWHNPWNHTAENIRFSLHNPRFHDGGLITFASYHAGFFQLDLRNPAFWSDPSLIAYGAYADGTPPATTDPVEGTVESKVCGLGVTVDAPEYMDPAVGPNGVLYFADVFMGLYTFVPTASHPVYGASRTVEYSGEDTPGL
jgi:hypothetical protein